MIIITVENGEPITTTLDQFIIDNDGFDDDEMRSNTEGVGKALAM
jgi:Fe-S-cluster formation regulator IscX/YfhJ